MEVQEWQWSIQGGCFWCSALPQPTKNHTQLQYEFTVCVKYTHGLVKAIAYKLFTSHLTSCKHLESLSLLQVPRIATAAIRSMKKGVSLQVQCVYLKASAQEFGSQEPFVSSHNGCGIPKSGRDYAKLFCSLRLHNFQHALS